MWASGTAPTLISGAPTLLNSAPTYTSRPTYTAQNAVYSLPSPAPVPTFVSPQATFTPTILNPLTTAGTYVTQDPLYATASVGAPLSLPAPIATLQAQTVTAPTFSSVLGAATTVHQPFNPVYNPYGTLGPHNFYQRVAAASGGDWNGLLDGEEDGQLHPGYILPQRVSRRAKALVVGISYAATPQQLINTTTDARRTAAILENLGYTVRLMLDDNKAMPPTKANLLKAMAWLVTSIHPGDMIFFYFGGHGWRPIDVTGGQMYDEAILPVDWYQSGPILDDTIHQTLVQRLPYGARLNAVMDCHYGSSGLDLPYSVSAPATSAVTCSPWGPMNSQLGDSSLKLQRKMTKLRTREIAGMSGNKAPAAVLSHVHHKRRIINADVFLFSTAKLNQVVQAIRERSPLTEGFLRALAGGYQGQQSYLKILTTIREMLVQHGSSHIAELSCSKSFDLNCPFEI